MEVPYSRDRRSPPEVVVWLRDGKPVSTVTTKWKITGAGAVPVSSVTTALNEAGRPSMVIATEYAYNAASIEYGDERSLVRRIGDLALRLVQPDALHAATIEDDGVPCPIELAASLTASGLALQALAAAAAADAALAGATALCASSPVDPPALAACASIPALTAAASSANLAATSHTGVAAIAGAAYLSCVWNHYTKKDSVKKSVPGGGGGGKEGGGIGDCPDIEWYISYDGGITWEWYETQDGGWGCYAE